MKETAPTEAAGHRMDGAPDMKREILIQIVLVLFLGDGIWWLQGAPVDASNRRRHRWAGLAVPAIG